jgi:hypothetical protein
VRCGSDVGVDDIGSGDKLSSRVGIIGRRVLLQAATRMLVKVHS